MAGRKPRLYDTVNKQWVDFKSLQEADALFKNKERNPFVTTKDYGITSRYRYDEPVNNIELATIAAGGKPKSLESAAAKTYKELNPDVDLASGQNAVGINPVWDRDYNFRRHPEWRPEKPIYYPQYNEYWGYELVNLIDSISKTLLDISGLDPKDLPLPISANVFLIIFKTFLQFA